MISLRIAKNQIEIPKTQIWRENIIDIGSKYIVLILHFSDALSEDIGAEGINPEDIDSYNDFLILSEKLAILLNLEVKSHEDLSIAAWSIWDLLSDPSISNDAKIKGFIPLSSKFRELLRIVINE